jgi:peptidoglycan/LPS O-acetylase OafA/YrhL
MHDPQRAASCDSCAAGGSRSVDADGSVLIDARIATIPRHAPDAHARAAETERGIVPKRVTNERFAFLDALRGLGALGIACYHVHRYRPLEIPADHLLSNIIQFVVRHGWASVQVFWVIAGFVVAYSLRKTTVGPASFGNFTLRRVLRLGIPYWAVILAVVAVGAITKPLLFRPDQPLIDGPVSWSRLAANLGFLQDVLHLGNISAGTWFVCVDLQFGLLFAIMLGLVRLFSWLLPGKGGRANIDVLILVLVFVPLGLTSLFWFNVALDDYSAWAIYYFHMPLFGAMAWWALERRIPRAIFWGFAAAMAAGVVYRWNLGMDYKKSLDVAVALSTGTVIYLVGRRGHLGDWLTWRPLQYLGRISYSLYLTHYLTSWIIVSLGYYWTRDNAWAAVFWMTASVFVSIGVADLFCRCVETPSLRLVKRLKA